MQEEPNKYVKELTQEKYKYGFTTDVHTDIIEKGLNEDVIRLISAKKEEPEWLLEFRLKAYRHWLTMEMPTWAHTLNPRTNIFDACDLSVRLMDGQHGRYISFLLSFVMYIPALLLVYPVFIIYPYFRLSYIVFLQDIMGSYWQDKMPSMIKRWRKYSK